MSRISPCFVRPLDLTIAARAARLLPVRLSMFDSCVASALSTNPPRTHQGAFSGSRDLLRGYRGFISRRSGCYRMAQYRMSVSTTISRNGARQGRLHMDIPGYRVAQEFLRSGPFILFRGRRMADGRPVFLKTPVRVPARAVESDALDREFELLGQLNLPGIPAAVDLVRSRGVACLVIEDRGLQPLSMRLRTGPLELPAFFDLAGRLCEILRQLHERQIIAGTVSTP